MFKSGCKNENYVEKNKLNKYIDWTISPINAFIHKVAFLRGGTNLTGSKWLRCFIMLIFRDDTKYFQYYHTLIGTW